ncbi:hypothetical protein HI914_01740 [Erysiphe necator]|nr:hypothetical protein HI914_01740 [Erysiphe necator]
MLRNRTLRFFIILLLSPFMLITARYGVCRISTHSNQTCLASDPTAFTVNDFTTFEPSEGNSIPASISFLYSDNNNALVAQCFSSNDTGGTVSSAISGSPQVSFTFTENNLTITEAYNVCSNETASIEAEGSLVVITHCYSNYPPSPYGNGIKCITPTGKLSGSFL